MAKRNSLLDILFFLVFWCALIVVSWGLPLQEQSSDFALFKAHFNKRYVSVQEEAQRLQVFNQNWKQAFALNEALKRSQKAPVFGITKFMDISTEQFQSQILMPAPAQPPFIPPEKVNHPTICSNLSNYNFQTRLCASG